MILNLQHNHLNLGSKSFKSKLPLITFNCLINKDDLKIVGSHFDEKQSLASMTSNNHLILWRWAMLGDWRL